MNLGELIDARVKNKQQIDQLNLQLKELNKRRKISTGNASATWMTKALQRAVTLQPTSPSTKTLCLKSMTGNNSSSGSVRPATLKYYNVGYLAPHAENCGLWALTSLE